MSPRSEELVVFAVTTVLVSLFAWIYLRHRQKSTGLWMLGWIAIFLHFAAPAVDDFFPSLMSLTQWIMTSTLILAGTGPESRDAREQWTLRDIAPLVREHFGL